MDPEDTSWDIFYEDMINIARVLPNLSASILHTELNTLKNEPDRVQIILKKYFASYIPDEHNCLSDDIKRIKRVLPSYPVVKINNDLLAVENKENRVHLVIKSFLENEAKSAKRCLDNLDLNQPNISKKLKSNTESEVNEATSKKEQSSDETETISVVSVLEEPLSSVSPEPTLKLENSSVQLENNINDQTDIYPITVANSVLNLKEARDNECYQSEVNETPSQTIFSVLSSLFPQYSSEVFSSVCNDLNINAHNPAIESTVDLVVNVLLNSVKTEQILTSVPNKETSGCCNSNENCENVPIQEYEIEVDASLTSDTTNMISADVKTVNENFIQHIEVDSGNYLEGASKTSDSNINMFATSPINSEQVHTHNFTFEDVFQESVVDSFSGDESRIGVSDSRNNVDNNFIFELFDTMNQQETRKELNNFLESVLDNHSVPSTSNNLDSMPPKKNIKSEKVNSDQEERKYNDASVQNSDLTIQSTGLIRPAKFHPVSAIVDLSGNKVSHTFPADHTTCRRRSKVLRPAILKLGNKRTNSSPNHENGSSAVTNTNQLSKHRLEKNELEIDDVIFVSDEVLPNKPVLDMTNNNDLKKRESTTSGNFEIENNCSSKISTNEKPALITEENHAYYFKLLEIFNDICPNYLKRFCKNITSNQSIDDAISSLLMVDYDKRNVSVAPDTNLEFEEQHKILQDLFPDADPTYLQHHCERLIDHPDKFREFVATLLENKNYPTKADYLKKVKLSAQEKQYTTDFDVKNFLEVIPNPEEYFRDPNRQILTSRSWEEIIYATTFLKNKFCTTALKDITEVFRKTNYSVLKSAEILVNVQKMKSKRKPYPVTSCKNIPLLQEIAYVKHKQEILDYIRSQEVKKFLAREQAKVNGSMKCCQCCYDDEIMPDDTATCESGKHLFCKSCIRKGCEVLIGDGKLDFPCLGDCDSFFTLQVLQVVLSPKVFSKMVQRKQLEEVKSAGIDDLEFCPFCNFATIPAPGDKIFRCLNDDCMKESCRLCKEPSHIPLRCDEVEKDEDVKMRTYIEDKMTEALLRKCYKCGVKFIKETGCNKMTCSCGAMMCYVCKKPVTDYKHFNGQGGDKVHLCPLYSDTHKLHIEAIKLSAESAKKELGIKKKEMLKIDPTVDLEQHYRVLAAQNPAIPNIPVVMPPNVLPQ